MKSHVTVKAVAEVIIIISVDRMHAVMEVFGAIIVGEVRLVVFKVEIIIEDVIVTDHAVIIETHQRKARLAHKVVTSQSVISVEMTITENPHLTFPTVLFT
jgi:hypothetical protein